MSNLIHTPQSTKALTIYSSFELPAIFARSTDRAAYRFLEFLANDIRNPNTRQAYYRGVYPPPFARVDNLNALSGDGEGRHRQDKPEAREGADGAQL